MRLFISATLGVAMTVTSFAQSIQIDLDLRDAQRLLALACSGEEVDDAYFASSKQLAAQLGHHSNFGDQYNLQTYLQGLRAISKCESPDPDPFRFSSLVERRDQMEEAINYLVEHGERLSAETSERLGAYAPPDMDFTGSAVMVAASFSCGGFAKDGMFFVDIPCVAADIEEEIEAVSSLVTHETYHAMQTYFMFSPTFYSGKVSTVEGAWEHMFHRLATEGTASHVGSKQGVTGTGRYSKFTRESTERNFKQLAYNFRLFNYMMEAIATEPENLEERYSEIYGLAFDGAFDQRSYNVGEQMTAEIELSFGAAAIPCLLAQPPENFALAYNEALDDGDNLDKSHPLGNAVLRAAHHLSEQRLEQTTAAACW